MELPPAGEIVVWRPRAEQTLTALPKDRVRIIQGFKPDHDVWKERGYRVDPLSGSATAALSVVCLPRAKAHALSLIASAAGCSSGPILVDGQKTDGVDSILKMCRKRATVGEVISKAHGKAFVIEAHDGFEDWADKPKSGPEGFVTSAGVFSADRVDHGSRLLGQVLPEKIGPTVADLGAGWGYLSAEILRRSRVDALYLVEAEHDALNCARLNIDDARAHFHWADATKVEFGHMVDTVVMNPPFHTGRAAEPDLGRAFVATSARLLKPRGTLWMVANRHLPYESTLSALFAEVQEIGGDGGFKLLKASGPRQHARLGS